ncbi:MAG TPA: hypothetical protein VEN78_19480 [Bradyrhizobium sp.]|nr:hypothetical protein [Bradyrhizobium sp.]
MGYQALLYFVAQHPIGTAPKPQHSSDNVLQLNWWRVGQAEAAGKER